MQPNSATQEKENVMKKFLSILLSILGIAGKIAFGAFKLLIVFLTILFSFCIDAGRKSY